MSLIVDAILSICIMWNKSKHIYKHIRITLLVLLASAAHLSSMGQEEFNPYVKSFSATAIDGKLYLSWTTRAGFTCQDIHIEVSNDSLDGFERRGTYYGVCGDASERNYSYVLENPNPNSLNYLKLELGTIGYSNTISLLVIKAEEDVIILPHPVVGQSVLHFENKARATFTFRVMSSNGTEVLNITTINEQVNIGQLSLPPGLFYYDLVSDQLTRYHGKLLITNKS